MFRTENARLLSVFRQNLLVFALWTYASLVVGGFRGVHRKNNVVLGAVPMLCACCADTPPRPWVEMLWGWGVQASVLDLEDGRAS